jgi:hypothetical protein
VVSPSCASGKGYGAGGRFTTLSETAIIAVEYAICLQPRLQIFQIMIPRSAVSGLPAFVIPRKDVNQTANRDRSRLDAIVRRRHKTFRLGQCQHQNAGTNQRQGAQLQHS